MTTHKGSKKPVNGNRFKADKETEQRQRDSRSSGANRVVTLDDEVQTYRRKRASIDGVQKHNYDGNISFDTADKLGEEIAALRTRK